jgi:hypothetical protein
MKALIRTIAICCAVNLVMAGSVFAGNSAGEEAGSTTEPKATLPGIPQEQPRITSTQSVSQTVSAPVQHKTEYRRRVTVPTSGVFLGSPTGGGGTVLVIPSAEITTQEIATISEDMNIMSRIFDKNLDQAHINVDSMFVSRTDSPKVIFGWDRQTMQGMYLQGYGALFLMKVDFPLSAPPKAEEEAESPKKEEGDPLWTQMKAEMYEPQARRKQKGEQPVKEYDPSKVENLKTTLIKSLKHASNIRNLKPDESVILTITGNSGPSGVQTIAVAGTNGVVVVDDNNKMKILGGDAGDDSSSLPTILVIRAKKSDIDLFAKGNIDLDQFQQSVQVLNCAYLSGQPKSADPFSAFYGSGRPY